MKLEVLKNQWDEFNLDKDFAYKDGKFYDIYCSAGTYTAGACLGRMRAIMDGDKVLQWIYPLMGAGVYKIINKETIEQYRAMVLLYDMKQVPYVPWKEPTTPQEIYDFNVGLGGA